LEFCDRLNALARLQKPNRLLLEIKHVPIPGFPFFICVSLSLLKQLAKGAVLRGQDHSLPKNQWLTEALLALLQLKGLWSQSIKSNKLQDAKRDESKVHNPSQSKGELETAQDEYP
jgi:hypothetical protein